MSKIVFSVDVEKDLHGNSYKSVTSGLKKFEKMCENNKIKPILFVTGDCVKKYPDIFKRLSKKGWDISFHGLTHKRFDDMSYKEKENEIKEGIKMWKSKLGFVPKGFRAPQHSIDNDTLDLLEKYGFEYDSSFTPLSAMEIIFFPYRPKLALKLAFSRLNKHQIRKNLTERPASALLIPFVSLTVRVLPKWMLGFYVWVIRLFYKEPIFYAHSWDFIEMKESKIDRMFPSDKFVSKLNYLMGIK